MTTKLDDGGSLWTGIEPEDKPLIVKLTQGVKHDNGKAPWRLMPWRELGQVVDVLAFGLKKYAEDNWKIVPNAEKRYKDALLRHVIAWSSGETNDTDSRLHHLAHACCNALFLLWFEKEKAK